ncbi:DUF3482 domain-containing protein [Pseudothauera nasutitermitis]|uniref:DUF3482 domain-containing protein n=1 Tax=Pseudothauera nasutitermitis TaxID=2565930 RepID=A0A4S4B053_9RHOO|nr:GTPase/DUF3482 domain-containing protein [Pseudothauera nasutitermitis]THF65843.1 DUF3482 domain-containing protein [Pseudothauera nasutitermitis]
MSDSASQAPVRIALVGHTNTGKTSLMRTLTRDGGFGEVSSRPSTTRHVEGARLLADGVPMVELYDTPGMEDASALFDELETLETDARGARLDGPARIERFLGLEQAHRRFEQEAKVLRQMLASDAALYVVDARDPVLAKHRDELAILAMCARPLLPVLNFVGSPVADEAAWRAALARLGLHAVVRFDTVAPERDGEALLYAKLATLLDARRAHFDRLAASRAREAGARRAAALLRVAELLVDVAAARVSVERASAVAVDTAVGALNQAVRAREQGCVDALLALYRFSGTALEEAGLPLAEGRWEEDLFHPETLRLAGVRVGGGVAAGAAAGFGVDLLVGGLTLGTATAVGALAGGGVQALRQFGGRIADRLGGRRTLTVADAVVALLAVRGLCLVAALERRGHAAMTPIRRFGDALDGEAGEGIRMELEDARAHPEWSALDGRVEANGERRVLVERVAGRLEEALAGIDGSLEPSSGG